jgi:ATP-dependent DNA helicase RecQ
MKLKLFTFRFSAEAGGFDDRALVEFLAEREALSVSDHFFVHEQVPTWALLVSYRDVPRAGDPRPATEPRLDWRAELPEEARGLFDALRAWRNERARREGRPPYVLLTNRQMADVARARPGTLTALRAVPGLGEAKAASLGPDLLAIVASLPPGTAPAPPAEGSDAGA